MKVIFVCDVHGRPGAAEWIGKEGASCDAVIVGGDLSEVRGKDNQVQFLNGALASSRPVLFVPGNWDSREVRLPDGVTDLHGHTFSLDRYLVGGLGGSNRTKLGGPFEMEEEQALAVLERLGPVDLLVTHSPPARTKCDRAGNDHIGSEAVREYVGRRKPQLVLCGHAHDSKAIDRLGESMVVNPGAFVNGNYAEIRLDGVISVELKSVGGLP